jgi:peptidoglycan/LPS O-acetylase OafA/YrhL
MATFIVLMFINNAVFMQLPGNAPWQQNILPFYGIFMLLCGLAAGIVGLVAVVKAHERSWLVWLAILPGLFALLFVLGEFLVPH